MKTPVTKILAGRRESELLAFPSARRMADILARRCRESSWVRASIATLERFRAMTAQPDLELLLTQARANPAVADEALAAFARSLASYTESQVSGLAMGPKLWFRLNGVPVSWRPLPGRVVPPPLSMGNQEDLERGILLGLIGSGLRMSELLRLRVCDIGSLDEEGRLIPDWEADPLAVQYTSLRGHHHEYITFLTFEARQALLNLLAQRSLSGQPAAADSLLFAPRKNSSARSSITRARQRSQALIRAGSDVNVTLCRATGDFFREWGLPGSRFEGEEELNIEEFI